MRRGYVVASVARAAPRLELEDPGLARARKQMSRSAWLAAWAAHQLLDGRGLAGPDVAAFFAVGPSNGTLDDVLRILAASTEDGRLDTARFARRGVAACNPLLAFQLMNNFTLCHAAIRDGLQGPNGAFFGAPTAALAEALRALEEVPWALVVAADSTVDPVRVYERSDDPGGEAVVGLLLGRAGDTCIMVDTLDLNAVYGDTLIHDVSPYGVVGPALGWHENLATGGTAGPVTVRREADTARGPYPADAAGGRDDSGGPGAGARSADSAEEREARSRGSIEGKSRGLVFDADAWAGSRGSAESVAGSGVEAGATGRAAPGPAIRTHSRGRPRRAVITGVGATSTFGVGVEALWDGLVAGRIPIGPAPHLPGFPAVAALAELPDVDLPGGWRRDRRVPLTVAAAEEAWRGAGRPDGLGLSLALGLEQAWLEDFLPMVTTGGLDWSQAARGGLRFRSPMDLPARALGRFPLRGPRLVHASACAGGTLAVAQAATWVVAGEVDRVLCGAGDSMLNPLGLAGLQKLGVTSPRGACRPFDLRRDGIVVGEGAACFVVEEEGSARARGAEILAVVEGWGSTQDGWAPTAPRPGGEPAERAMTRALARAGRTRVEHVSAHGTGTPLNDEAEVAAVHRLLPRVEVGSFKGALGHTMAAAGALEIAALLAAFVRGVLPGTPGFEVPDPACPLPVRVRAGAWNGGAILKNSFGFGGQDASVVIGPR